MVRFLHLSKWCLESTDSSSPTLLFPRGSGEASSPVNCMSQSVASYNTCVAIPSLNRALCLPCWAFWSTEAVLSTDKTASVDRKTPLPCTLLSKQLLLIRKLYFLVFYWQNSFCWSENSTSWHSTDKTASIDQKNSTSWHSTDKTPSRMPGSGAFWSTEAVLLVECHEVELSKVCQRKLVSVA